MPNYSSRRPGDDADRAAFGIAAEQSALRAAQHFDPVDVEQRRVEALRAGKIDAIDIDADGNVAGGLVLVERNDSANTDGQRRLARFEGRDAKARDRAVAKVQQAVGMAVGERLAVGDADRDRRLLQVRLALGRGDDDRAKPLVLRGQGAVLDHGRTARRPGYVVGPGRGRLRRRLRRRVGRRRFRLVGVGRSRNDLRLGRHGDRSQQQRCTRKLDATKALRAANASIHHHLGFSAQFSRIVVTRGGNVVGCPLELGVD